MIRSSWYRWTAGIVAFVVAVAGLTVVQPQPAAASDPAATISDFSVLGGSSATFSVSLSNFAAGTYIVIMSVPEGDGTLTLATETDIATTGSYTKSGAHEIGFEGELKKVTAAMTSMTYTAPAETGSVTLSLSISQTSDGDSPNANLFYNSGNGNYYELVDNGSAITWAAAETAAAEKSLLGATGYLATITSEAENTFIAEKTTAEDIWIGASDDVAVVNAAIADADPGAEGAWYWVTGPVAERKQFSTGSTVIEGEYAAWASGEPNNSGSGENFAVTNWSSSSGEWNDLAGDNSGVDRYLVEYTGADTSADSDTATATISLTGPTVSAVSPAAGSEDGGTFITVTGTGFTDSNGDSIVSGVTIGGVAATSVDNVTATTLTALTPASTGSAQQVIVTTSIGSTSDAITFDYEAAGLFPSISDLSPTSGSVSGGTSITVQGSGFTEGSQIFIDGVGLVTTRVSETELTATTPDRTGSDSGLTVGSKTVQVRVPKVGINFDGGFRATGEEVFFSYAPLIEDPNEEDYAFPPARVELGSSLADRTQAKPLTKSGTSSPYTMSGYLGTRITDTEGSDTTQDYIDAGRTAYSYQTDSNYSSSPSGNGREGFEITDVTDIDSQSYSVALDSEDTADEAWRMTSSLNCGAYNNSDPGDGVSAYCSIFGPQVVSEPFYATAGQSITFTWKARGGSDDYEVYAYLVEVESQSDTTFADGDHTTILHSRGRSNDFTTSAADISSPGLYRFRFVNGSYDASGGKALGAQMYVKTSVILGKSNSITFADIADRETSDPDPFTTTASATSGAEVSVTASGACSVTTSHADGTTTLTVTRTDLTSESCSLTASQDQVGLYAPAASVTRSFAYPEFTAPNAPTGLSAQAGNNQATVTFTAPNDNGGSAITNYQYQLDDGDWVALDPASTSTSITITGLTNGTLTSIKIRAVNGVGNGTASAAVSVTPVAPAEDDDDDEEAVTPVVTPPPGARFPIPRPNTTAELGPRSNVLSGPVLRNGLPPRPTDGPSSTVNGQRQTVTTRPQGTTGVGIVTGRLAISVQVPSPQEGRLNPAAPSGPELEIVNGRSTQITGSGSQPGSVVQVFLPLNGSDSRELAQIPVGSDGSFSGEAVFRASSTERPLPIGRTVLQVVSTDDEGNQTVIDLPINVAQPPPTPELNATLNAIPTLRPGQSIATEAGQPVPVQVIAEEENRQARVEGDGWTMAVDLDSPNARVSETGDGGALLELTRDETARVSGDGFMPGTRADVFLFSTPTLLGTVTIDENGAFDGVVNVDSSVVTVGEHTMQLQGVGEDGYVRAANLGVVVNDQDPASTASNSLQLLWWILIVIALAVIGFVLWLYWRRRQHSPKTS